MRFLVVVFSEAVYVVESGVVALEGLEEPFYLAEGGGFSNGAEDVLYSM